MEEVWSETRMKASSNSLRRLEKDGEDPYQSLANAIVCVAADDYRTALQQDNIPMLVSLRRFFRSEWYSLLTKVDPMFLTRALESEHKMRLRSAAV